MNLRRPLLCVVLSLLVLFASTPLAADITNASLEIQGIGLTVVTPNPPVTTGIDIPTTVQTKFGGKENDEALAIEGLLAVGDLTGPGLDVPLELSTAPGHGFDIPGLTREGVYTLQNIRLMKGRELLQYATPSAATIVVADLFKTTVEVRQLSPEEIRLRGIVIDARHFEVYEYTLSFFVDGKMVKIPFPVVIDPRTREVQALPIINPYALPPVDTIGVGRWTPPEVVTVRFEEDFLPEEEGGNAPKEPKEPGEKLYVRPPIPAAIVIPNSLAVMHQYGHGVGVYDLNAVDANYRKRLGQGGTETTLNETLVLLPPAPMTVDDKPACDNASAAVNGYYCDISNFDLMLSPDAAIVGFGATGVGVFALHQNRGIAQLNVDRRDANVNDGEDPNVSYKRAGSLVFAERVMGDAVQGRPWSGHPRLNMLRRFYREASSHDPQARYTSIATYTRRQGDKEDHYALVAGFQYGLLVAKLGREGLTRDSLVDVVWIPAGAYSVRVQDDDLAVVVDGDGRVLLINLKQIDESDRVVGPNPDCTGIACEWALFPSAAASLTPVTSGPVTIPVPVTVNETNSGISVGWDDPRIVWKSEPGLVTGTLAPIVDTETGFVYTGNVLGRKMNVVSAVDPRVRFIGANGADYSKWRELSQIIPLGIEEDSPAVGPATPHGLQAAFRILVSLPGSVTESLGTTGVAMAVESERVLAAVTGQTPPYLPRAHLRQTSENGVADPRPVAFTLQHDAPSTPDPRLRFQRGWNRMVSKWIVAVADPRASEDYDWGSNLTAQQKADRGCYICERPSFVVGTLGADWYELYTAGRVISVRPERAVFEGTEYAYLGEKERLNKRVSTTMADTVRPIHVLTPAHSAPVSSGAHQETIFVHSGEVMTGAVDLDAGGRAGWNVVVDRTYRSRTLGLTPLGAGWDSSMFQRLRLLPNRAVEYRDGSGETWRFTSNGGSYTAPEGFDATLSRTGDGWRMSDAKKRITDFDGNGRIVMQADDFYQLDDKKGNIIRYAYGAEGLLARITDPVGRATTLKYDQRGLLEQVKDWRDREILFHVDSNGLLGQVELPRTRGSLGFDYMSDSSRPKQSYGYRPSGSAYSEQLELGTNLARIREPGDDRDRVTFEYEPAGDKRDMVTTEKWGTTDNAKSMFEYRTLDSVLPVATETVVHDARGQTRTYRTSGARAPKNYSADRVHTEQIVEASIPVWKAAAFGALPASVSPATSLNETPDRTWKFEYVGGRLKSTKLMTPGSSSEALIATTLDWTTLTGGAVLGGRQVTSPTGDAPGSSQVFNHSAAYLDSVEVAGTTVAAGMTVQVPEPRPVDMPKAKDGGVERTTELLDDGQLKSVATAAVSGSQASGAGSITNIAYHGTTDSVKHRRGMPQTIKEGSGVPIETNVTYDPADPDTVNVGRAGRDFNTYKQYDQLGRLILVEVRGTNVDTEEIFAYDARGRLVRHRTKQDAARYVEERYAYDVVGRVIEQETYEGAGVPSTRLQRTTSTYNLPERVMRTTLPTGGEIETRFDGLGRVQDRTTDPRNPAFTGSFATMVERTRYDVHGNVVFQSDDLAATASRYDALHRPVETLLADGTRVKTTYDGFGRVTKVEDTSTGLTVTNEYTPAGKLISTSTNNSLHQFTWDGAGRTRTATSNAPSAPEQRTEAEYDDAGRLLEEKSGEGLAGRMVREYDGMTLQYGASDQASSATSREDGGTARYTVTLQQDAFSRATKVTSAASDMNVEQQFDAMGNVTSAKTPEMRGTAGYAYDGRGLMTEERQPGASGGTPAVHQRQYDANGLLKSYIDPTTEATRTERDGLGRPFRRTYEDMSTEEIHYDRWRVERIKDRQDRWQRFGYDAAGRLETIISDGVELDRLTYDAEGRLIRWRTPESQLEMGSFDTESRPQLTRQIRYRADGSMIDEFAQSHTYDGFGRRTSWTMPGTSALTTGPWATSVSTKYDAAGNLVRIDRAINGLGLRTLLTSDYRASGRPKHRTLNANEATANPIEIRREYDYELQAGRMTTFRVFSAGLLVAGSEVTFEGTSRKSARLLGLSNGERTTSWEYDDRGRLRASAPASTNPSAALLSNAVVPRLNDADFLEAIETSGGGAAAPSRVFNESTAGHKIVDAGDGRQFQYKKADGRDGGGLRTRDAHFEYEFDQKERLRKATQLFTGVETSLLRVVYSYSGAGRMIGRRMEIATVTGGVIPAENAFVLARPDQLGPDAALPASTTFVWDPISDQLVAVFEAERMDSAGAVQPSGRLIRQYLHGGLGLDDPIEVTVAEGTGVARYYPIYDEAGDGGLQAILDESGRIVNRTILTSPYGDGEVTVSGPAVESVTVQAGNAGGVQIDVAFTEPIDGGTLASGVQLAATTSSTMLIPSTATPQLADDGTTVRWMLTQAQWSELASASNAQALSIAVTNTLRSSTFSASTPVAAGDTTQSGVSTSSSVPFELQEAFTQLSPRLTSSSSPIPLYRMTSLVPSAAASALSTRRFSSLALETADSAAALLLTASFQAQSFSDPFTLKNYVRARWYDPSTGTFLSPDPLGYQDSSNLYAFAGGDPVNGRDPTGEAAANTANGGVYIRNTKTGARYKVSGQQAVADPIALQDLLMIEGGLSAQEAKDFLQDMGLKYTHPYQRPVVRPDLPKGDSWWKNALIATSGLPPQNRQQEIVQGGLQIVSSIAMVRSIKASKGQMRAETVVDLGAGPVPVSYADAQGWVRDVPNQWGKKGCPAHQCVIDQIEADIVARGLRPQREFRVDTPGGKKSHRDIDIVAIDPATGQVVEIHQVGKGLKSNKLKPVIREREAMQDLRNRPPVQRAKRIFHPYN